MAGYRLYTLSGADWAKRYPLIVHDAATRIEGILLEHLNDRFVIVVNEF